MVLNFNIPLTFRYRKGLYICHVIKNKKTMTKYILKISELKSEVITYCGYIIDNCYVFAFEDNSLFYIPTERLKLYELNGKLKNI